MGQPVLDISGLRVAYGDRVVLDGIDLSVDPGQIAVVLGNSGCGKSTLLKAVVGLLEPLAGSVRLFGEETTALPPEARGRLLRRVGVTFQHGALLNSLTVGENVALALEMHTGLSAALVERIVRTRLDLVGLSDAYGRYPDELSGGMRKRAALARALVLEPEILFCDEPGAGLDPVTAAGIDRLLLTLNRSLGTALVVITHELLSIRRLDGRLLMLDRGRAVFSGGVAEAAASADPVIGGFFNPGD